MPNRRLTIQLEGPASQDGHVRLEDFIDRLERVRDALTQTARVFSEGKVPFEYRVVSLSHKSPATVVLEEVPRPTKKRPEPLPSVIPRMVQMLRAVARSPAAIPTTDLTLLETYRDLAPDDRVRKVVLRANSKDQIAITGRFRERLDKALGPDESTRGSIAGELELISVRRRPYCAIYPFVGPPRVRCDFSDSLRSAVVAAIGRYVRVYGVLHYKSWSPYPYRCVLDAIDVFPEEADLPKLAELAGAFKTSSVSDGVTPDDDW